MKQNIYTQEVGNVINHEGVEAMVKEQDGCNGCFFKDQPLCPTQFSDLRRVYGDCSSDLRIDGRSIIFLDLRTKEERKVYASQLKPQPSRSKKRNIFY